MDIYEKGINVFTRLKVVICVFASPAEAVETQEEF